MADRADRRRQPAGRKSRQSQPRKSSISRVTSEKVSGISTVSSSFLTSDPNSGRIAYPAGCVVVSLHPQKNEQSHIINGSRKPFTASAFSHDGKHSVTGESGHKPCVRVWEVGGGQAAEVQAHKYGVSCVAFSFSGSYVVSVGFQHDRTVSVWDWRKGSIIASNKVSSRVFSVSFSQDGSYFVTAGNRHIKFWDSDASKERRVNSTVPSIGRSGLLGDHKNSVFCGVACGRGSTVNNTYCVTTSGMSCSFNSSRQSESWVDSKTSSASSSAVSEDLVFCGCADGVVRVFRPSDSQYIGTSPRPHRSGVDSTRSAQLSSPPPAASDAPHPDTSASSFDPRGRRLSCVYNDHSVYVWDVRDVRNAGRSYSASYHSSCVWNIQVYPESQDPSQACSPPSSFLTCSSDNTIRSWCSDAPTRQKNLYSQDSSKISYVGEDMQHSQAAGERGEADGPDGKAGIRVSGISPDGKHSAAGDRCGNSRIFGSEFSDESVKIEAHDSEVLCSEFSPSSTGVKSLASASRDRSIHVFNSETNYNSEQTSNDHSASITAVKFTGESPEVRMVSCGADKSIYFQTAEQTTDGLAFSRRHHVVEKTLSYDMDSDPTGTRVSIACQDRNVRVYNVETGKSEKCSKGSTSDEGAVLKVQTDPSGSFFATSCSDKNITIFDSETGECVATSFGHSESVSCMKFSQDCRHSISASGDSCIFVWRSDSQMTGAMRKRRGLRASRAAEARSLRRPDIRRETFISVPSSQSQSMEEEERKEAEHSTPGRPDAAPVTPSLQTNGKMPMWFRKSAEAAATVQPEEEPSQVRSRWAEPSNPSTICTSFSPSPGRSHEEEEEEEEEEDFQPQSSDSSSGDDDDEEEEEEEASQTATQNSTFILQPDGSSTLSDRDFRVEAGGDPPSEVRGQGAEPEWRTHPSPDSACSEGSTGSSEQQQDTDTDSSSRGSSVSSSGPEEDEEQNSSKNHFESSASSSTEERFDTDSTASQPTEEKPISNPRLSISTRFSSRFQDRLRVRPGRVPISVPGRISEESGTSCRSQGKSEPSCSAGSAASPRGENADGDITSRTQTANGGVEEKKEEEESRLTYSDISSRPASTRGGNKENPPPPPIVQESERPNGLSRTAPLLQEPSSSSQVLATPTTVTSQAGESRFSVSSLEETPTNPNRTLIQSPAPSAPPTVRKVEAAGVASRTQTDPVFSDSSRFAPPTSSSPPMSERLRPQADTCSCPTGEEEGAESIGSQRYQQVANESRQATRRAMLLYRQAGSSHRCPEGSAVSQEAFAAVHGESQEVMQPARSAPSGQTQDDQTTLSEKYSELSVQMTRNKSKKI